MPLTNINSRENALSNGLRWCGAIPTPPPGRCRCAAGRPTFPRPGDFWAAVLSALRLAFSSVNAALGLCPDVLADQIQAAMCAHARNLGGRRVGQMRADPRRKNPQMLFLHFVGTYKQRKQK